MLRKGKKFNEVDIHKSSSPSPQKKMESRHMKKKPAKHKNIPELCISSKNPRKEELNCLFHKTHEDKSLTSSKELNRTEKSGIKKMVSKDSYNPYVEIYNHDLKCYQEYLDATDRYVDAGINLKWPYYFGSEGEE